MWIDINDRKPEDWQKCVVADISYGEINSATVAIWIRNGFSVEDYGLIAENFDGGASISLNMDITHWFGLTELYEIPK